MTPDSMCWGNSSVQSFLAPVMHACRNLRTCWMTPRTWQTCIWAGGRKKSTRLSPRVCDRSLEAVIQTASCPCHLTWTLTRGTLTREQGAMPTFGSGTQQATVEVRQRAVPYDVADGAERSTTDCFIARSCTAGTCHPDCKAHRAYLVLDRRCKASGGYHAMLSLVQEHLAVCTPVACFWHLASRACTTRAQIKALLLAVPACLLR